MMKNKILRSITLFIALAVVVVAVTGMLGIFPQSYFKGQNEIHLAQRQEMVIYAKDGDYNNITLSNSLLPNASYMLEIEDVVVTDGHTDIMVAALFDANNQSVVAQKVIAIREGKMLWNFITPDDTQGLQLLLYPEMRGNTQWVGIKGQAMALNQKSDTEAIDRERDSKNLLLPYEKHSIHFISERDDPAEKSLSPKLQPGQGYTLTIGTITMVEGEENKATVVLFNEKTGDIIEEHTIEINSQNNPDGYVWNFTVPQGVEDAKLRVYAGEIGKTGENFIVYEELALLAD